MPTGAIKFKNDTYIIDAKVCTECEGRSTPCSIGRATVTAERRLQLVNTEAEAQTRSSARGAVRAPSPRAT